MTGGKTYGEPQNQVLRRKSRSVSRRSRKGVWEGWFQVTTESALSKTIGIAKEYSLKISIPIKDVDTRAV